MPFEIVRNDITNMRVDAIVNTANPKPIIGSGTDAMIHKKAGPGLLAFRQKIGAIPVGSAAVSPAFGLQAKCVIHTVGPVWRGGGEGEAVLLNSCYYNCLQLAMEYDCHSIAFPLISAGNYGFPKDWALQTAIDVFTAFLKKYDLHIYLVVFDRDSYRLSEKLFQSVASYIDENYVERHQLRAYGRAEERRRADCLRCEKAAPAEMMPCAPMAASLEDVLRQEDAGFTETLLKLIDRTGKKDSEVYKRANLSKQHFSKIRNNPHYKPTKPTAITLALALELSLDETKDLIGRAGYALTNSSKFDLIIRYFIEQGNYNVVEINCVLFEHDQSLLGA